MDTPQKNVSKEFDEKKFRENLLQNYPTLIPSQVDLLVVIRQVKLAWKAGEILGISERTVESRVYHIRKKMNMKTKDELWELLSKL